MKNIFIISQNTFRELLRNRVLYSLVFFALFLVILMIVLGQLSFAEQYRLSVSLGLASVHMCLMGLTIFVGGSIVFREIDKLTILTVLVRPLSRTQFLIGKYLGFLQLMFVFAFGFFSLFSLSLTFMAFEYSLVDVAVVFVGMFLEIMVLLAISLFFSTFSASFLTIIFTISFFLIGHWSEALSVLLKTPGMELYTQVIDATHFLLPNLEIFNWRLQPIEPYVDTKFILRAVLLAFLWSASGLSLAALIFRKRDFA